MSPPVADHIDIRKLVEHRISELPLFLSVKESAKLVSLSERNFRSLLPQLVVYRRGGKALLRVDHLLNFMDSKFRQDPPDIRLAFEMAQNLTSLQHRKKYSRSKKEIV
jgi:hypothetical protein